MSKLKVNSDPRVDLVFKKYPRGIKSKMKRLRKLVLDTAKGIASISEVEETLKWGEPSYLTKKGSTLRMDWKSKNPGQYAMYFQCTSQLVPTFKKIFPDKFNYEKNRAILFDLNEDIPEEELKECIELALTYHSVKHLPWLGKS